MGATTSKKSTKASRTNCLPTPSYLVWTPYGYHFRMRVPFDLQEVVGQREIRYSLQAGFLREAKPKAQRLASFVQQVFYELRYVRGGNEDMTAELNQDEIRKLLRGYLNRVLKEDEECRVLEIGPKDRDELEEHLEFLSLSESELREALALNDYKNISRYVDDLLKENGVEVDRDSDSHKKLCREMIKTQIKVLEVVQKRSVGDYSSSDIRPVRVVTLPSEESPRTQQDQEHQGKSFSEVMAVFMEERWGGKGDPKTAEDYRAALDLFVEVIGDIPMKSVNHDTIREYKKALMRIPRHARKKYKDKSYKELIEMELEDTLHPTTINKKLKRMSTFLKFAVKNKWLSENPVPDLFLVQTKSARDYRAVYTSDDLKKLFQSDQFVKDTHKHSFEFWTPLLGLYTGCRLEELCQLHLEDVREEKGVWIFDINNNKEKRLKTRDSARLVPIHPVLLDELKLVEYVRSLRERGEERLFPELSQYRDGYSPRVSAWYSKFKRACGIIDDGDKKKDFHSFRHTFINTLVQRSDVKDRMIKQLVGHADADITSGRYGKRVDPKVLLDVINKLDYEVDFQHLSKSKFVF
jgi:integrase